MAIVITFIIVYGTALVIARAAFKYLECIDKIDLDNRMARKQRWLEENRSIYRDQ